LELKLDVCGKILWIAREKKAELRIATPIDWGQVDHHASAIQEMWEWFVQVRCPSVLLEETPFPMEILKLALVKNFGAPSVIVIGAMKMQLLLAEC
jgi:hypothetical protein